MPGAEAPLRLTRRGRGVLIAFAAGALLVAFWLTAGPGAYVFGPRNIPHGFKVLGAVPARMLLLCAPAGFTMLG